jgi:transcriptional regulator with XRE-family HTH domain
MSNFQHIGERLREERERLKHNQTVCAELGGVTRKTVFSYETGDVAPSGAFLLAIAEHHYDSGYVLFGRRTPPSKGSPDHLNEGSVAQSETEARLLLCFRNSSPEGQSVLLRLAELESRTGTQSAEPKHVAKAASVIIGNGNMVGHGNKATVTINTGGQPTVPSKKNRS